MTNNKHRVTIAARKRGISPAILREIFKRNGCPPTLAEKPAVRYTYNVPGQAIRTFRRTDDFRDITAGKAAHLIEMLGNGEGRMMTCGHAAMHGKPRCGLCDRCWDCCGCNTNADVDA